MSDIKWVKDSDIRKVGVVRLVGGKRLSFYA